MINEEGFSISDVDTEQPEESQDYDASAKRNLEQMRMSFAYMRNRYLRSAEGGIMYNAVLAAYGPKTAESLAAGCRHSFEQFCKNAHLTTEGVSTNPALPTVDRLLRNILRDNRARAYVLAAGEALRIEMCLPEDPTLWSRGLLELYLSNIARRYAQHTFYVFENNLEVCGVKATPPHILSELLSKLAAELSDVIVDIHKHEVGNFVHSDEASDQLRRRLVDMLSEGIAAAILHSVPYATEPQKEAEKPALMH